MSVLARSEAGLAQLNESTDITDESVEKCPVTHPAEKTGNTDRPQARGSRELPL
jgi:hypothetical protein